MSSLTVKYGLGPPEPTDMQIRAWLKRVRDLIQGGMDPEASGRQAAKEIFSTYGRFKYASQADTIHDLIQAAATQAKQGR